VLRRCEPERELKELRLGERMPVVLQLLWTKAVASRAADGLNAASWDWRSVARPLRNPFGVNVL
jgi:hypothetical protein